MIRFNQIGPSRPLLIDPDAGNPGVVLRLPQIIKLEPMSVEVLDLGLVLELPAGLIGCLSPAPELLSAGISPEASTLLIEPSEARNGLSYGVFNAGDVAITLPAEMPIARLHMLQVIIPTLVDDPRLTPLVADVHAEEDEATLFGASFNPRR